MREQHESTKLEFLMMVNDNIIVQRFFNVRDFNPNAKNSTDLYELIKDFKSDFEQQLKMKTVSGLNLLRNLVLTIGANIKNMVSGLILYFRVILV